MVLNKCANCLKDFPTKPYRKNIAKYCSSNCYWGKSSNLKEKKCSCCKNIFSIECFTKINRGWSSKCKLCKKKEFKNWSRRNLPYQRYRFYEWNSKRNGREFNISFEMFKDMIAIGKCFYCGDTNKRLGLDRIDSNLGYITDNVVACCRECNIAKSDMSQSDFIKLCKMVTTHHV